METPSPSTTGTQEATSVDASALPASGSSDPLDMDLAGAESSADDQLSKSVDAFRLLCFTVAAAELQGVMTVTTTAALMCV